MNQSTVHKLLKLNQAFYHKVADSFSATRSTSWPGWEELLKLRTYHEPIRVLDVGCGNGRLGKFLIDHNLPLAYTGLDQSKHLLELAKPNLRQIKNPKLIHLDLARPNWSSRLDSPYDLVACFGVLHHLPSLNLRSQFLATLKALVTKDGFLCLSFWQFDRHQRFSKLIIPWSDYNRQSTPKIPVKDLETGDYLLKFAGESAYRYCHSFSDPEIQAYLSSLGLQLVTDFNADGKGFYNRYLILKNT